MAVMGRATPGDGPPDRGAVGNQDRYAESDDQFNTRVRRDRVLGASTLVVSVVVLVLNLIMELDSGLFLLPGGHSELYFVGGALAAGASAWVAFDLGNNRRVRR
ncbi:MAG: hypothetical protein H0W51_02795 [Euzebyales bacterium]|nr:hypothetical protein [Euzebyales bacterium]